MDPNRWRRVDAIVDAVSALPETERAAALEAACGLDVALRREVESLLAADREDDFLAMPAAAEAAPLIAREPGSALVGRQVGRFAVLSLLGRGGMGEVYLAHDPRLQRLVALKFRTATFTDDRAARELLLREARAAAGLAHPAVCRVFELGEVDGRDFIVMEHLEGETLAARLARGPVATFQAVDWGAAVAAALEEAHDRGLVHRDLKPANVMVLPNGEVKVMDFGVARLLRGPAEQVGAGSAGDPVGTLTGALVGTPGYIAPEQLAGQPADQRADVWALGCVLYEMLTGERAFGGATPDEAAAAVVGREPDWQRLPADTPPEVRRLLARCLAKNPRERTRHAAEVRLALAGVRPTLGDRGVAIHFTPARRARRLLAALAVTGTVVATGYGLLVASRDEATSPAADETPIERTAEGPVTVAGFANRTGDPALDDVGKMIADSVSQELPQLDFLRLPAGSAATNGATPLRLVVTGAYYLDGDNLRVHASLLGSAGEVLHGIPAAVGSRGRPGIVVELVRQRVLGAIAAFLDPRYLPGRLSRPPLYAAYQQYRAGIDLGVANPAAIPHLERAAELDPDFFAPLQALAALHSNLGDPVSQREILARAQDIRERLTRSERLDLDRALAEADGRHLDALRALRQRLELEPENPLMNYLLALHALRVNRPREALVATSRVDRGFFDFSPNGPWAYSSQAEGHHLLGLHAEELGIARRGRAAYPSSLQARAIELYALAALGHDEELARAASDTLALDAAGGRSPGSVLRAVADELRAHGRRAQAVAVAERAVAWYRGRPPAMQRQALVQVELAEALYAAERWSEAAAIATPLLEVPDAQAVRSLGLAGVADARRGESAAALRHSATLATLPEDRGQVALRRAAIAAVLGEREQAVDLLRDAIAKGYPFGMALHRHPDLGLLRGWAPYDDLMRPQD
jgi:tetratricopeptide (TPR) repeat protein